MIEQQNWNIIGTDATASALRQAARQIPTPRPLTIATSGSNASTDVFGTEHAALGGSVKCCIPWYSALEVIEDAKNLLDEQKLGKVYGIFASMRLARGKSADDVLTTATLPILAVVLDLLPTVVSRVWARRASLSAEHDAWFITLRCADDVIATIEAGAIAPQTSEYEMLLEITAADAVVRAEPTRQAVVVETTDAAPVAQIWWEDLPERYLKLVARRSDNPDNDSGARLRSIWQAIQDSATTGVALKLD